MKIVHIPWTKCQHFEVRDLNPTHCNTAEAGGRQGIAAILHLDVAFFVTFFVLMPPRPLPRPPSHANVVPNHMCCYVLFLPMILSSEIILLGDGMVFTHESLKPVEAM